MDFTSRLIEDYDNRLTEAPIGVDSSEYVDLNNISNVHVDSSTGNFVGVRTQQGERPEFVIGNVDDMGDTDLSIRTADKVKDKEFIDNAERRKELAKKILNSSDKIVKHGSDLAQKNESLEEDYDTSTEAGRLKDMLQILVDAYGYEDVQFEVSQFGYDLADYEIVDNKF